MRTLTRFCFVFIFILKFVFLFSQEVHKWSRTQELMASPFAIVVYSSDTVGLSKKMDIIFMELEKAVNNINYYDEESEVNQLAKAQATGHWIPVSKELKTLLKLSKRAYYKSNGIFDVSIGRIIQFWKSNRVISEAPDTSKLLQMLPNPNFGDIKFRCKKVKWGAKDIYFDFGGIGKGYISDLAMEMVRKEGYRSVLINAGGDMVVGEEKPTGPWKVGLELPGKEIQEQWWLELENRAVATSGTSYQSIEIENVQYSHIIHPQRAWPVSHLSNVTVIAPKGWMADYYASYLSVLNPKEAIKVANESKGIEVLITFRTGEEEKYLYSDGFGQYLVNSTK